MTRRKLNVHTLALWAALPMARTAQVEGRIKMILTPTSRRALTRRALAVSLTVAALGISELAALRPEARAQAGAKPLATTAWKQTLPNGATVEVLGVMDPHAPQNGWWKPDGRRLAGTPFGPGSGIAVAGRDRRVFALRVGASSGRLRGEDINPFAKYDVSGATTQATFYSMISSYAPTPPELSVDMVSAGADALPTPGTVRCGVAAGPWKTLTSQYVVPASGAMKSVNLPYQGAQVDILFSPVSEIDGAAAVTVTNTIPETVAEWRILALDTAGKVFHDNSRGGRIGGKLRQGTCIFEGLPRKRVRAFRFQARPYQWAEFRGIALTPKN